MAQQIISRRKLLKGASAGSILLLTLPTKVMADNHFSSVRILPSPTYTRITFESDTPVRFKYFTLSNPNRLVVDVENITLNSVLNNIKVQRTNPHISNIRAGQKDSQTVRIVFDLKSIIQPQVSSLAPSANLKNRLVVDLYPNNKNTDDPIQSFLNNRNTNKNTSSNQNINSDKKNTPAGRRPIIMLDPGHGGEDTGAISPNGLQEKVVVLAIAREAKKRLESMGYQVKMTRNDDVFIDLKERLHIAHRANADIFVSIHANSVKDNKKPHGTEIFTLSKQGASSEAARLLEEKENNADNMGGVKMSNSKDINNVLVDMVQSQTLTDSNRLARLILNQIGKHIHLKNNTVDHANFVVLRSPDIPSVLVETAFLSNPQDEALLANSEFQRKIGNAIADGIKQYLGAAVLARR